MHNTSIFKKKKKTDNMYILQRRTHIILKIVLSILPNLC